MLFRMSNQSQIAMKLEGLNMDNHKHSTHILFILLIASVTLSFINPVFGKDRNKPRIIATTDGEIDDRCSMVRFLMYANEWDIEGIVICSSKFHWKGHSWAGEKWIDESIDLYAKSYENLKKHDPDFPSPEELKNLVYIGNIDNVGEMSRDTPGSDLIVQVLLDDEPGPVYLQAWGGTNTIARAQSSISFWIRTRHSANTSSQTGRILWSWVVSGSLRRLPTIGKESSRRINTSFMMASG